MTNIKTPEEIAKMREGGLILAQILHELALATKIGIKTEELNLKADALMSKYDVAPSFKNYRRFPASICASVNEQVVHGIPGKRILQDGDILTIDCGVFHKGLHTDAAVTIMIGNVKPEVQSFVKTVQKSLEKAISVIKPGANVGDIGFTIQTLVESHGYSVVRDFTGHGVGRDLHEPPEICNFGKKGAGALLVPGMTLAIEPIIAMGKRFIDTLQDGWTTVTRDGLLACQVEHTVVVTPSGCEILTKYNNNTNCIYPQ